MDFNICSYPTGHPQGTDSDQDEAKVIQPSEVLPGAQMEGFTEHISRTAASYQGDMSDWILNPSQQVHLGGLP